MSTTKPTTFTLMEPNGVVDEKLLAKENGLESEEHTILSISSQRSLDEAEERDKKHSSRLLTSREMESLVAICDTFLPSIDIPKHHFLDDPLVKLYQTSASMAGTPDQVAMMMIMKTEHPKQILLRVTLWFLSTWIGTIVLCGRASLSNHFPYVQKFSRVSTKKREEILLSWSLSYFFLLRMLFRALKMVVPLAYFTQASSFSEKLHTRIYENKMI